MSCNGPHTAAGDHYPFDIEIISALTAAHVRPLCSRYARLLFLSFFLIFRLHSSAASQRIESLPHRAPEGLSSIRSDQPTPNAGPPACTVTYPHDERGGTTTNVYRHTGPPDRCITVIIVTAASTSRGVRRSCGPTMVQTCLVPLHPVTRTPHGCKRERERRAAGMREGANNSSVAR